MPSAPWAGPTIVAAVLGAVLATVLVLLPSGRAGAQTPTLPPPNTPPPISSQSRTARRSEPSIVVNDSRADVDAAALDAVFRSQIGAPRGLHGIVLIRDDCGGDPETVLDAGLVEHGGAQRAGEMFNDAVAWLICRDPAYTTFSYAVDNPLAPYLDPPSVAAAMADALATGDAAAAAAAGLAAVAAQLDRAPIGISARPTPVLAATPVPLAEDAAEASIAATLIWVLLGALALGGLHWLSRRRRETGAPAPAPEPPAVRELDAQITLVAQRLVTDSPILDRVAHALEPLGDRMRLLLLRRHQAMIHRAEALARDAEVVGHLRAAGELPDRGDEGLLRVEELLVEARALGVYVRQLEREAKRAARLHENAAVLLDEAEQSITAAREAYGKLRTSSATSTRRLPSVEASFAVPVGWLATARDRAAAGALLDAGTRADDAIDLAARIVRVARRLRRTEGAVADVQRRITELHDHAPESWVDVVGNGAEAEASLDAAAVSLEVTLTATLADLGTDAAAGLAAGLSAAAQELLRARQLVAAIDARARHLEAAKAAVGMHGAAVRANLSVAQAQSAGAPTATRAALAAAAEAAQQGDAAADTSPPDWARAVERWATTARTLCPTGTGAVGDGPSQDAAQDAAERAVTLARVCALAAVDRADRYLQAHRRDCSPTAVRRTTACMAQLREADRNRDRRADPISVADGYRLAARTAAVAFEMLAADAQKAGRRRVGWRPRGQDVVTVAAMASVQRVHPFPGRLGPWEPLRASGAALRPGAWGALPPGIEGRPTGW